MGAVTGDPRVTGDLRVTGDQVYERSINMDEEMKVNRNIMINKAGGKSGSGTKNYRVSIPAGMIKMLGVTEDDRAVTLEATNGEIIIKKA